MLVSSSKLFLCWNEAHLNSGVRLLLELYCVKVIKHVAFFTICAKLTLAFTFTSLPLNFYTSVSGCGCGFGFEQKYWRIDRFGQKRDGSADLHTPIHPPPVVTITTITITIFDCQAFKTRHCVKKCCKKKA